MDFFISYTKADNVWAQWIAWELEKEGYDCVIQAWDFRPGGDFMQQMRAAVEAADQTIAVFSPEYFESTFAAAEMNAALVDDPLGIQGKLVPVRIAECEPAGLLRGRVYIDLVGKAEEVARRELLQGISASRLTRSKPAEAVHFPAKPSFPGDNLENVSPTVEATHPTIEAPHPPNEIYLMAVERPLKILFLASDAGVGLNLTGEFKKIKAVISSSTFPDSISLFSKFDVSVEDLFQSLNEYRPHVLHFSGNMDGGSVLLSSKDGGVKTVKESALVGLLRVLKDNIRLVILNACNSLSCAEALSEVIDCTIGIKAEISDSAAITFSESFYRGIGFGRSVKDAFDQARVALLFEGISEEAVPELRCREGVDPGKIVLVQGQSESESLGESTTKQSHVKTSRKTPKKRRS